MLSFETKIVVRLDKKVVGNIIQGRDKRYEYVPKGQKPRGPDADLRFMTLTACKQATAGSEPTEVYKK